MQRNIRQIFFLFITILGLLNTAKAAHLKGGWIQYQYLGPGSAANTSKYLITIRQYLKCSSAGQQIDGSVYLGIYDAGTYASVQQLTVDSVFNGTVYLNKVSYSPCINPKPAVCYLINKYQTTVELPNNNAGYILAVQRCCRVDGIINVPNSGNVGITYSNKIPGVINGVSYQNNNSPSFVQKDTVLVCYSTPFTFNFSATDADGDSLSYVFCDGLDGASSTNPGPTTPTNPPFTPIPYNTPLYDGTYPLGSSVTIDPVTGIISGVAPPTTGDYVVAVCAQEFRKGVLIGSTKKEIHITVADCSLSGAQLKPEYLNCNNLSVSFFNESNASNIISYLWTFGDTLSPIDSSNAVKPTHNYTDTGTYKLTLTVTATGGCQSSDTSLVKVYPGFKAYFTVQGTCVQNPYLFFDSSFSKYGAVNYWRWNMGEPTVTNDTFSTKDPSYTYPTTGPKTVTLYVTNTNGCSDSTTQTINIVGKPPLGVAFNDTLICFTDSLQLQAIGTGSFVWTSSDSLVNSISFANTANPVVFPKDTTQYYVSLNNNGCVNTDTVIVNVLKGITVKASPPDTSICQNDTVQLFAATSGLGFYWTSNNVGQVIAPVQNPIVTPSASPSYYYVTATLGKCTARDSIKINVYPYPVAKASGSNTACSGTSTQLNGYTVGSIFYWSPSAGLSDSLSLNPLASPDTTTTYVLTALDTAKIGCAKSATDTIVLVIIPPIKVSAGNDTTVVVYQPLQFNGTSSDSAVTYYWTTIGGVPTDLNNNGIPNPIGTYGANVDSITYVLRATDSIGCYALDTVKVNVYKTPPDIFVPTGFSPDCGCINSIEKPVPIGLLKFDYFSIYDRWGRLLYTTTQLNQGWDGSYNGKAQPPGTYVYVAEGVSYSNQKIFKKGTVVLIR